ncbi:hypothetical protein [Halogeometricum limi]|uniref:Uncharacterized protein n=1 Tax=Halogeometricum limi TaxID=555875 RepID=A0A1I6FTM6_9EURY|nr:hypothetical protein [Halogeometricum limi]SFR33310.1 hypothetical protein SAMN04488124_0279 [Halogeometricum limi]
MPTPSRWWYGVALFPVVVLTTVVSRFGLRRFTAVAMANSTSNDDALVGLVAFVVSILADYLGVLVALLVVTFVALDVRALRDGNAWRPSRAWILAGVAHLVGAVFSPALLLSVPSLTYYLYRRRERVGLT